MDRRQQFESRYNPYIVIPEKELVDYGRSAQVTRSPHKVLLGSAPNESVQDLTRLCGPQIPSHDLQLREEDDRL